MSHSLSVQSATEPSNVTWRNLAVTSAAILARQALTSVVTTVMIVIGIGVSMIALFLKLVYALDSNCLSLSLEELLASSVCLQRISTVCARCVRLFSD
jgi:hypothetical protein